MSPSMFYFFFFNDTATTEIYTLSLHDALPICVGHGEVVTGLDAHLAPDLDLPAQVHEERPVRHVDDLHPLHRTDRVDDLLAVRLVARLEGDVARDRGLADDDQVDGADIAAGFADRRGDPTEHPGLVHDLEPDREAVAIAWSLHSRPPPTGSHSPAPRS